MTLRMPEEGKAGFGASELRLLLKIQDLSESGVSLNS